MLHAQNMKSFQSQLFMTSLNFLLLLVLTMWFRWLKPTLFTSGCNHSVYILPLFLTLASHVCHHVSNCKPPTDQVRTVLSLLV